MSKKTKSSPQKIAITGSTGAGKTTICEMLKEKQIPVISSDDVVRDILVNDSDIINKISEKFPNTTANGTIDRKKLKDEAFKNTDDQLWLEQILYPKIAQRRQEFVDRHKEQKYVAFEIPLLFEKNLQGEADVIICVTAPKHIRKERALQRPGMTEDYFETVTAQQWSDEKKAVLAHYVIDTDCDIDMVRHSIDQVLQDLT